MKSADERIAGTPQTPPAGLPKPRIPLSVALRQLSWRDLLVIALAMSLSWCTLFMTSGWLQILAGIIPVLGGFVLGRRIRAHIGLHGWTLGLLGFTFGLIQIAAYAGLSAAGLVPAPTLALQPNVPGLPASPLQLIEAYLSYSVLPLIPFPAFGTILAARTEERNRALQAQVEARGGKLENAGVIRVVEDLRGLSLPQFGSYVVKVFRDKGFTCTDYLFLDKDKFLDLDFEHKGKVYLARLSVADKVRGGSVETLVQEMKRRNIPRGMVITSTEFMPDVQKSAKSKRGIVLIDGPTLFEIAQ